MMETDTRLDADAIAAELFAIEPCYGFSARHDAGDGYVFTYRVEPDDVTYRDVEDPEVFGQVSIAYDGRRRYERPDDFTGAASKFWDRCSQGVQFWYEPPADFRRFKGSGFPDLADWERAAVAHRDYVIDRVSFGYSVLVVELEHTLDSGYSREWSAALGAVDESYVEAVADLVAECIDQMESES